MNLDTFFSKYNSKQGGLKYSNQIFIEKIFHPVWGNDGLELIEPEVDFRSKTNQRYRIDFLIKTTSYQYLLEIDDYGSHAGTRSAHTESELKKIDIENSLIRNQFFCPEMSPDLQARLINIPLQLIKDSPGVIVDSLNAKFIGDNDLNIYRYKKIDGEIILTPPQQETLEKINKSREAGDKGGLISLTTALGKTFISVFHAKKYKGKVLFLAHMNDILRGDGAQKSFIEAWPEVKDKIGLVDGDNKEFDESVVISTVQTMVKNLDRYKRDHFSTIIIDECHHASAPTYLEIIDYFTPDFLLGMTATPVRTDHQNVTEHFYNNLIHEITRDEAISKGWICSFEYRLQKDNIDYENIHWNGWKYDEEDLNKLLMVKPRDEEIEKTYSKFCREIYARNEDNSRKVLGYSDEMIPIKTIGFCHSIKYAEYMAKIFKQKGHRSEAVHSTTEILRDSDRQEIINKFRSNQVDVIFTVNLFNEGVDFPDVECILMLRPTESHVIMSQQLGRGLRISDKKEKLTVLDFVSNDRRLKEKFAFLGFREMPEEEQPTYYFNNNGNRVIFTESIYNDFIRLQDLEREIKPIDKSKISEFWMNYGEELKYLYRNNYYWHIGKMPKNIKHQLQGVNILFKNPDISDEEFKDEWFRIGGAKSKKNSGFRSLILSKRLGFLDKQRKPTKVFYHIKDKVKGNFSNLADYSDIVEQQLQKSFFFSPYSSDVNKHGNTPDRIDPSKRFSIFFMMYLYSLILKIGNETRDYFITNDEFNYFVVVSSRYSDLESTINQILDYRKLSSQSKIEVSKFYHQIQQGKDIRGGDLDTRVDELLPLSIYLDCADNKIRIIKSLVLELEQLISNFEYKFENGIDYYYKKEKPDTYLKLLESIGTPWQEN